MVSRSSDYIAKVLAVLSPYLSDIVVRRFAQGEPWHRPTIPDGGAEWGREMVEAWATGLADELDVRCGRASAEEVRQRRVVVEDVAPVSGSSAKL